jgi:hypothetical protein
MEIKWFLQKLILYSVDIVVDHLKVVADIAHTQNLL